MKHIRLRLSIVLLSCLLLLPILALGAGADRPDPVPTGYAYAQLNNNEKLIYQYLREQLTAVAEGSLESTKFEVPSDVLAEWEASGLRLTFTERDAVEGNFSQGIASDLFVAQFSYKNITTALVHDCPFELYWYDKTVGSSFGISIQTERLGDVTKRVTVTSVTFSFHVSPSYANGQYAVDTQKTKSAAAVVEKARAIIAKYANASDYGKLIGYRDEICALVSYNDGAVSENYTGGYGDPWQLIYVFDGDSATNVVCEGYAKAFQYLCDLTDFSGDVSCYTANGMMSGGTGAGAHMWNLVRMEDGKLYLVDVTNSDESSVGQDGGLFLAGGSGSPASGYVFAAGNTSISYAYAKDYIAFWNTSGILSLSSKGYEPPTVLITLPEAIVYDGAPLTAGRDAEDVRYLYGGESDLSDQYTMSHAWHTDANGSLGAVMAEAPKDAGAYWIVVTATRGAEVHRAQQRVVIAPATPTVTPPTGLTATYGDTLQSVKLPEGFAWKDGTLSVGNAGVNRFKAIYTPTDTQNYTSVELEISLTVAQKDISGMIPEMEQFPTYWGKLLTIEAYLPSLGDLGVAYTVSGDKATDVGVYVLTLTGIGNYCGKIEVEWKILPDLSKIEGLTPETVKESDRAAIEAVKASIKSDAARAEWADVLKTCDALLAVLDAELETTDVADETTDAETTKAETTSPERDTEPSGGSKQDIVNLPAGCSITIHGSAALGLILLISCAAVLVQKKRTRVD